ncbi:cytochrome P450, putative [Metarhizium acridum CQMa 102]|uniref:Cytochrome P450, putative n=1 Tax=Metarhizium acridum (strain CQMa 102) TaxID=655827 RepID=E9DSJ7_METAQ|nr:cytochrome P450, putative [Metarhizium acridum CQMa 102]EFY93357.1 cytochrome P450, putative [Metarhizium acridum CQMa 102]
MESRVVDHVPKLVGVALVVTFIYSGLSNPLSKLPGPWYSKWTDLAAKYHYYKGNKVFYVHNLHKKFGPYVRIGPNEVSVADLDATKIIYSTKETFRKTIFYRHLTAQSIANIFTTADVDYHRKLRRLMSAQLSESSLKSLLPAITSRVELAIQRMKEDMETRGFADVFKWSLFMTTDVIGELAFGESFQMLEKGEKNQYIHDLEGVGALSAVRVTFPRVLALARKYPLPIFQKNLQQARRILGYAEQSLQRYQYYIDQNPEAPKQIFVTKMFKAREDEKLSFSEIVINAQSFIVAGSDTTSNSLTYLLWSVCRRPELRDALVRELQTLPNDFTEHDLRELPFLSQCIEETLRLYSAVPAPLPREVPQGGVELGGYWLPGGTTVATQAYTMHRHPEIFPNPDEFDPYRWASPTKAMKEAFMPFGRGPRRLHLAYIELRLATARFFQEFPTAHISAREGMSDDDMIETIYFLMSPKGKRCLIEKAS